MVVAAAACTPDPPSTPPLPPVLGHVWDERTIVADGKEQTFRLGAHVDADCAPWCERLETVSFVITVPAGALPVGAPLVARLVSALTRPAPPPENAVRTLSGSPEAIHLLPTDRVFAQPLRVSIKTDTFPAERAPRSEVFHAREADEAWTLVGPATIDVSAAGTTGLFAATLSAGMTEPGLWTLSRWFP
jgi:hypothetical protein